MKNIKTIYKSTFLSLIILTSISINPVFSKTDNAKLDKLMSNYYKKDFNGVVLVAQDGKIIYEKANGYADFKTKKNLTNDSVFNLASVSKQFTAMAIMMLKERGKLNYNDPITKFLPQLPYKNITVENLVYHTSGLADYLEIVEEEWDESKLLTNQDIVKIFAENKPKLEFSPGTKYEYSNTGYAFLASVIEKASGQTFERFITDNIFKPLNMTDSFVYSDKNLKQHSDKRVLGYEVKKNKFKLDDVSYLDGVVGDGGIYSTADDLFKWDQALYTEKLVKNSTLNQGLKSGKLKSGKKTDYGFGWEIIDEDTFFHNGSWAGFRTSITRYVDTKSTVIMLTNTGNEGLDKIETKIEDQLYN